MFVSNWSIKHKLIVIMTAVSTIAVLLSFLGFLVYDSVAFKGQMSQDLVTQAEIIGHSLAPALREGEARRAQDALEALRAKPQIRGAGVYTPDGDLLATYSARDVEGTLALPQTPGPLGIREADATIRGFHGIVESGEVVGTLYLVSDLRQWNERVEGFMAAAGLLMAGALVFALLLSARLQRMISAPVSELERTMTSVTADQNYELRATRTSGDEIGSLVDRFNTMLSEIQRRDGLLQSRNSELEEQTRRLAQVLKEREAAERELQVLNDTLEARVRERSQAAEQRAQELALSQEQLANQTAILQSVLNSMADGVVVVNDRGQVIVQNPAARDVMRMDLTDVPLTDWARHCEIHLPGQTSVAAESDLPFCRALQGEAVDGQELRIERPGEPDGIWLSVTARSLNTEEGSSAQAVAVLRDITDWKRAEEQLIRAKNDAETARNEALAARNEALLARNEALAASRSKSEFLANMSHEIRTPMNGVLGMTELLLGTSLTREQEQFAATAHKSAEGLLRIINDILDFSKLEAGKFDLVKKDFDLLQIVEDVSELLANSAYRKGVEMSCWLDEAVPTVLSGDPDRISQILTNLVGNAVKFTDQGEIAVRVKLVDEGERSVRIRAEVADTGRGVPEANQKKIFEAFTQADSSTTRRHGGTGLGLVISRQLVEMMGGEIGLESVLGEGSTFWFTANLEKSDAQLDRSRSDGPIRPVRVMVVDDNETNRTILEHHLKSWDLPYATAASGVEALQRLVEAASKTPYDVAIIDMQMPEMNGVQLAEKIQANEQIPKPKMILLTSAVGHEVRNAAQLGFVSCLSKPVRKSRLYRELAGIANLTGVRRGSRAPVAKMDFDETVLTGLRVLLAEDNAVNQEVGRAMLEGFGCDVEIVSDGKAAVEKHALGGLDVVLMDCQMPEMDGYEATGRIREIERETGARIPIIALTAHAMEGDRKRCLQAGMDDHVSKPFSRQSLGRALVEWARPRVDSTLRRSGATEEESRPVNSDTLEAIRELERAGTPGLVRKVIETYLTQSPRLLSDLEEAIRRADAGRIRSVSHSLKSSSANLGALRLAVLCGELESSESGGASSAWSDLFDQITREYAAVEVSLGREAERSES